MPNERIKQEFPFKIGADPEFNYTFQQKRIIAQALLQSAFRGKRSANMGYNIGSAGNLGWDGNSATAEIRPTPSASPKELVKNIGKLLAAAAKPAKLFQLSTLSNAAPVGGHLHLELYGPAKEFSKQQFTNLHKKMATYYLPIMMGENKINTRLRLNTGYGALKDWRTENGTTFEFRVPSAEWLTTPKIAEGVIAYLGCLWHQAVTHPETFRDDKLVYRTEKQGMAIQEIVVSDYTPAGEIFLKEIKRKVKDFEFYPVFKEQIDYVLNPAKVLMDKERVNYNIKTGWAFPDEGKVPSKRELHNKKQIIKKLADTDVDAMLRLIQIPMNQDANVNLFAQELKKVIVAYGWNLENNYHIFGLKDGVPGYAIMDFTGKFAFAKSPEELSNALHSCKTVGDFEVIRNTMSRMKDKLVNSRSAQTSPEKNFIVGLNYNDRIKENASAFLDIVLNLEKNQFETRSCNTSQFEGTEGGALYEIYHKSNDDVPMVEESNRFQNMPRLVAEAAMDYEPNDEEYDKLFKVETALRDNIVEYISECVDPDEGFNNDDMLKWLVEEGKITNKQYKNYVRNYNESLKV